MAKYHPFFDMRVMHLYGFPAHYISRSRFRIKQLISIPEELLIFYLSVGPSALRLVSGVAGLNEARETLASRPRWVELSYSCC